MKTSTLCSNQLHGGGGCDIVHEEDVPQGLGALVPAPEGPVAVSEPNATSPPAPFEDNRFSKLFPNSFKISGIKHVCDNALSSILSGLPQMLTSELVLFLISMHHFCNYRLLLDNFLIRGIKPKMS